MAAVDEVRLDIIDFFRKIRADAGHILPARAFFNQVIIHYSPKQSAALDDAVAGLENDGIVEKKSGDIFLTVKGVNEIY